MVSIGSNPIEDGIQHPGLEQRADLVAALADAGGREFSGSPELVFGDMETDAFADWCARVMVRQEHRILSVRAGVDARRSTILPSRPSVEVDAVKRN